MLWIRVDPAPALVRKMRVEQPEFAWHLAALHDRDINSQLDVIEVIAVLALSAFSDFSSKYSKTSIIIIFSLFRILK